MSEFERHLFGIKPIGTIDAETVPAPCLRSGFCCKQAPCPFGKWNEAKTQCEYLVGDEPGGYECGIYDEIVQQPGAELVPAFGAGCCSNLNSDRIGLQ